MELGNVSFRDLHACMMEVAHSKYLRLRSATDMLVDFGR
jgi:hypothetical protein